MGGALETALNASAITFADRMPAAQNLGVTNASYTANAIDPH
jgi:hypothetical protein